MTYEGVLLQRVYQFVRESDGVISARKLISSCTQLVSVLYRKPQEPLDARKMTYVEKTCCLTSEEGFEFSAPMLLRSEVRVANAMMQLLGEVGAHSLGRALRTL